MSIYYIAYNSIHQKPLFLSLQSKWYCMRQIIMPEQQSYIMLCNSKKLIHCLLFFSNIKKIALTASPLLSTLFRIILETMVYAIVARSIQCLCHFGNGSWREICSMQLWSILSLCLYCKGSRQGLSYLSSQQMYISLIFIEALLSNRSWHSRLISQSWAQFQMPPFELFRLICPSSRARLCNFRFMRCSYCSVGSRVSLATVVLLGTTLLYKYRVWPEGAWCKMLFGRSSSHSKQIQSIQSLHFMDWSCLHLL